MSTNTAHFLFDMTSRLAAITMEAVAHISDQEYATLGYASPDEAQAALIEATRTRLPRELRRTVVLQLAAEGMSQRQIAAAIGVDHTTVLRDIRGASAPPDPKSDAQIEDEPGASAPVLSEPTDLPEDNQEASIEEWNKLNEVLDLIEHLSSSDASFVAATIPPRRRAATARRIRKLGTYLGRIAWSLEGSEAQE